MFTPSKSFQPSIVLPCHKHYTRLESLARSKHSSNYEKFVAYGRKKFYNIGPGAAEQTYFLTAVCFRILEALNHQLTAEGIPLGRNLCMNLVFDGDFPSSLIAGQNKLEC